MDDSQFQSQIDSLRAKLDLLPEHLREKLASMIDQIVQSHVHRRRLIAEAMDALAELRLQVKYLIFDLEATRRENEDLRRRLGEA